MRLATRPGWPASQTSQIPGARQGLCRRNRFRPARRGRSGAESASEAYLPLTEPQVGSRAVRWAKHWRPSRVRAARRRTAASPGGSCPARTARAAAARCAPALVLSENSCSLRTARVPKPPATGPRAAIPGAASSPSPGSRCAAQPALLPFYIDSRPCVNCDRALTGLSTTDNTCAGAGQLLRFRHAKSIAGLTCHCDRYSSASGEGGESRSDQHRLCQSTMRSPGSNRDSSSGPTRTAIRALGAFFSALDSLTRADWMSLRTLAYQEAKANTTTSAASGQSDRTGDSCCDTRNPGNTVGPIALATTS